MAKGFSVTIEGVPKLKRYLKSTDSDINNKVKVGLTKAAIFLQGEVKLSIAGKKAEAQSVDTGRFLNSVDLSIQKDNASVFSKLPYAQKLEFGTNFKNSPRKHFRNSATRSKPQITNIIQKQVDKI